MKTTTCARRAAGRAVLLALLLALLALPGRAQFAATAEQTKYVCNATGNQLGVQAVADGADGSFVTWIDKRGGNNAGPGTGIYLQHLDAQGVPQLAANGTRLYQTKSRDVFFMQAVAWNGGLLVAWVQGGFGIGGDTVRCQYYTPAGVAQWAQPTVVGTTVKGDIVYVGVNGLNIVPTSTGGAIITFDADIIYSGSKLAFNQVSKTGALRYALNSQAIPTENNYFHTIGDGSDGFYLVSSTGGQGTPLRAQRVAASGSFAWANYLTIAAEGDAGRGADWLLLTDPASNLYVAWTSNAGDPLVSKVLPSGALAWAAPGYVNLCTYASRQSNPHAIWHANALWMTWEDSRAGTGTFDYACYAQKVDATGKLAWSANGVPVYTPATAYLRPKLAAADNGSAMVFFNTAPGTGFRAQKLLPTGAQAFPAAGVALNTVFEDRPNYLDYAPVAQPNGSVQVYWTTAGTATTGQDIAAGRVQRTGTLLGTAAQAATRLGFAAYPNPARTELRLQLPAGTPATNLRLYDAQGRLAATFAPAVRLALPALAPGLYVLRATLAGQEVSTRVAVE